MLADLKFWMSWHIKLHVRGFMHSVEHMLSERREVTRYKLVTFPYSG